jgi:hypothetical protein
VASTALDRLENTPVGDIQAGRIRIKSASLILIIIFREL